MNIQYVKGDATNPQGDGNKIIVHICNDIGGWGKGFVVALSKKWSKPEKHYRQWYKSGEKFLLGEVQFVPVESTITVANMIAQHDIQVLNGIPPIRYDAVREGLKKVVTFSQQNNASVHMPRIGAGLAGGKWEIIEDIIRDELTTRDIQVTVYDLL
ncbi:macro domain-containing protein [Cytophagaceae bacterium YF14B1]|uniref:Macro domain-containing protein n=1 Tax=Xanthocytophaga flava TaxID=3048013 RepID=A0AAE3QNU5_9BACT|nr:macro domain-containing protein [Xanthocytophaga flavus]MDJ1473454.1 macro domain-containing protein [Xanthocytophaga flavus]MDJ1482121.1 macro domain-containing protein [Xanthocytophaga flavus]